MENIIKYNKNKSKEKMTGKAGPPDGSIRRIIGWRGRVSEKKRNRRFPEIILHRSRIRSGWLGKIGCMLPIFPVPAFYLYEKCIKKDKKQVLAIKKDSF